MSDIFLSYARDDVLKAKQIAEALESMGWTVWWDADLRAGETFDERLEKELTAARCVLVLWSKTSVERRWVKNEAAVGLERSVLVSVGLQPEIKLPLQFRDVQTESLANWSGSVQDPPFVRVVEALGMHLGEPPSALRNRLSPFAQEALLGARPSSITEIVLPRRGRYFPSPADWKDEILYLLVPDRFSDGRESERPVLDRSILSEVPSTTVLIERYTAWAESGANRWQGGTLRGVMSKLDYLQALGVTTLWLWPVWKQRAEENAYHGWAVQDFLDVDPRLGTREDLVMLVAAAHAREMRVLLSTQFHNSATNWLYAEGTAGGVWEPAYTTGRYAFGSWRSGDGRLIAAPEGPDDGVWPIELQDPDAYARAGSGRFSLQPEDNQEGDTEFWRADFFGFRRFDENRTLRTLFECHRYWLALTDCDGLYIGHAGHQRAHVLGSYCRGLREFAAQLGKNDFLVIGDGFWRPEHVAARYEAIGRRVHTAGGIGAIVDNGPMRLTLQKVASGFAPGSDWFEGFLDGRSDGLGEQRSMGSRHISLADDGDNVFGPKLRLRARLENDNQVVVALALQLFSLGIPCLYYGTEQGLGALPHRSNAEPRAWGMADTYMREAMFGPEHPRRHGRAALDPEGLDTTLPGFGPFATQGRHVFDSRSSLFRKIAALTHLRRAHAALCSGRQYERPISLLGTPFAPSPCGEIIAWARVLGEEEVLCVVNPNPLHVRGADVLVDATLNRAGSAMSVILSTASIAPLEVEDPHRPASRLVVGHRDGCAYVQIRDIPPGEVVVLSNSV